MRRLLLAMAAFALAAGVNTASVELQQRRQWLTRRFKRCDWYVHLALITPSYVWLFCLLWGLNTRVRWPLPRGARRLALPVALLATALFLGAAIPLGPAGVLNGYFFGRSTADRRPSGIFRWLRNPSYDGYVLAFLTLAYRKGNAIYVLLAAESFALLNLMEASVENRPFQHPGEHIRWWLVPF